MNVIYMHTHDSGRYWSPYGHAVPTPNIMTFAQDATLFRQAFCVGPTCSPSRAGLLTGQNPHSNGMQGLAHLGWQLTDYNKHLATYLKQHGYHTALCGIQHEAPNHSQLGYSAILGSQQFSMGDTENSMEQFDYNNTNTACDYIKSRASDAQPFFLSFGLFNTHREFPSLDSSVNPNYVSVPPPLFDNKQNRQDMAAYHVSVKVADNCFGQLLCALEESGLADNTIVVMTTDHGIAFPHMKCTLSDNGIGVALVIRLPKKYRQIKITDAIVSQLDIFPTICDAAGIPLPNWLEGTSLMPLMQGKTTKARNEIFAEVTYHAAYEPKRCIRTQRYKLIRRYDYHNSPVPANIDDCHGKEFLVKNGYLNSTKEREYLFDIWLDPLEKNNLAGHPEHKNIYNDLSQRLENWMLATKDPLIAHGARVPKPDGARIIKLESISPRSSEHEQ